MVTGVMIYCEIGALIWVFLDRTGVIQTTYVRAPSRRGLVLATAFMIVGWPYFVFHWVRGDVRVRQDDLNQGTSDVAAPLRDHPGTEARV